MGQVLCQKLQCTGASLNKPPAYLLQSWALFTQRRCIIAEMAVRQFSTVGCSHRAKHLRLKDKLLCNSHRKLVLRLLKRCDASQLQYFFPHISCQRQSSYVTFVWSCNVALWDMSLYSATPSIRNASLSIHTVWFANTALLTLPPEAYLRQSEISPFATFETFTQRRRWRISTGSQHSNGSVTGTTVSLVTYSKCPLSGSPWAT